jgi:hypothetical protein
MIFAFEDDGTLSVHDTEADVQREYEGVDVADHAYSFFSEQGQFLEPIFVAPNKRGKVLGLLEWVESGTYRLAPDPSAAEESFALALSKTSVLNPNRWFASLAEVKSAMARKGVVVEVIPQRPDGT